MMSTCVNGGLAAMRASIAASIAGVALSAWPLPVSAVRSTRES
jgi:hypothetical protein